MTPLSLGHRDNRQGRFVLSGRAHHPSPNHAVRATGLMESYGVGVGSMIPSYHLAAAPWAHGPIHPLHYPVAEHLAVPVFVPSAPLPPAAYLQHDLHLSQSTRLEEDGYDSDNYPLSSKLRDCYLRKHIKTTAFGSYCRTCNVKVAPSPRSIKRHIDQHNDAPKSLELVNEFAERAKDKAAALLSRKKDLSAMLVGDPIHGYYCTQCDTAFEKKSQAHDHLKNKNNTACSKDSISQGLIHRTVCGRVVSPSKAGIQGNDSWKEQQSERKRQFGEPVPFRLADAEEEEECPKRSRLLDSNATASLPDDTGAGYSNIGSHSEQRKDQHREKPTSPMRTTPFVAARATNAYVEPIANFKKAGTKEEMEQARRHLKLDPKTMSVKQIQELKRCQVMVPVNEAAMVTEHKGPHVIAFATTITSDMIAHDASSERLKIALGDPDQFEQGVLFPAAMVARKHSDYDSKRTSNRTSLGLAETATNRYKNFEGVPHLNGVFFPRIGAAHENDHTDLLLSNFLPMLASATDLVDGILAANSRCDRANCSCRGPSKALDRCVGDLPFPYRSVLQHDGKGKPEIRCTRPDCERITRTCSRMSFSITAGVKAKERIVTTLKNRYNNIDERTVGQVLDPNGSPTCVHTDKRDVGLGGEAMQPGPMERNGMEIAGCEEEMLQLVVVVSRGTSNNESLCCVGEEPGQPVFTFQAPPRDPEQEAEDGLRMCIYAMDYSHRYHGNICQGAMPQDAWALRITTYATVHAATWNKWIASQSNDEAEKLLKVIYGL